MNDILEQKLIFATKAGNLKLVDGKEFEVSRKTCAATKLVEEDEVLLVAPMQENQYLIMHSDNDFFLKIESNTIPEKKKNAVGVRGIKLSAKDFLKQVYLLTGEEELEVEVKGKKISLARLHVQNRDSKGVKK